MAWMETHYYSHTLKSNITLNVLIPTPKDGEQMIWSGEGARYDYENGLPVLYLLHGAFGDAFSWLSYSNIERYAEEKGMAVVMASAENSFYHDLKSGKKYKTFFTEELPLFIQSVFAVSKRREDTYIAGLSMGGYGAWYLALTRPELYSKAASLSGAVDAVNLFGADPKRNDDMFHAEDSFGDVTKLEGSEHDLLALYRNCQAEGNAPKLYQAVGTEDFLYAGNVRIKEELQKMNADLLYEEGPGVHDWNFWDEYIKHVLDWLTEK